METKLAIPVVGEDVDEAIKQGKAAAKTADIVEFRADFVRQITDADIEQFYQQIDKPVIFTCRPQFENGHFKGSEKERKQLILQAIKTGYEYVDVEYKSDIYESLLENSGNSQIILSHHNFEETPDYGQVKNLAAEMSKTKADILKIIPTANSINDNFKIFRLLQSNPNQKLISFCMGIYGHISRVLCKKYGSYLSFAALDKNSQSADGQISVGEMQGTYHFNSIDQNTKILGVAGEFAENSKSKYMHNPVFENIGKNYVYLPLKVQSGRDLDNFMDNFHRYDFAGMAVTIPHKEKMIKYMDELDKTAKEIGAVNTVVKQNDRLKGFNTDYVGAVRALENYTELNGKKCMVIGAGGASRAVVFGLVKKPARVTITNRTREKAEKLAKEFGSKVIDFEDRNKVAQQFDIIINTTSVGMYPDTDNTVLETFNESTLVMDIVYKPLKTKFLQLAEQAGCEIITGEKMLVYQAMEQFEIWTGQRPKFKIMHKAFSNIPE
ncbi:MAG: shikimate dehydrogenase [Candidatus Marinimicrobia bacterium]|nr:shikimate dehydrogenase [Candidatus Neomarinimicrobiota bacterium]